MAKKTTGRRVSSPHAKQRKERRNKMLRRVAFTVLVIGVVGATVFFLVLRRGSQVSIAENAIGSLFSPVQSAFTEATRGIRDFFTGWRDYDKLQEAYDDLYYEKQQVDLQLASMEESAAENERLKVLLEAQDRYEALDPVYAKVIARDPGRWFDTFSINRCSSNGISVGMAVCTGDGLVGRVYEVGLNYSKVITIVDPRSAVACLVSRTRHNGVMRGQISESSDSPDCYVYYLPNVSNIVPGDEVITSGTDSLYPKGLSVGEVTAVSLDSGSEGNYVVVRPYADFQHIEEVLVLREIIETDDSTLAAVPTPTPKPIVTPTPTVAPSGSVAETPAPTVESGSFQMPTPTPIPDPNASATPAVGTVIRYESLPEDSWAE